MANKSLANDLKNHTKFNKRHQKGMGWWVHPQGDPQKAIDHFNHLQTGGVTASGEGAQSAGGSGDAGAAAGGMGEGLEEDTEKKKNGKWVNKGKEGEHGEFKTKKAADAQRKAMFANGYHESLDESIQQYKTLVYKNVTDEEPIEEYTFDTLEEAQEYGKRQSLGEAELYQILDMRAKGGPQVVEEHHPQDEKIDESIVVEDLGPGRNEVFQLIKEMNPNAREANYVDRDVNQMLAILNKLRNKKSPDNNANNIRQGFTGVKRDPDDGQLYHYQDDEKGELASEEESDWEE